MERTAALVRMVAVVLVLAGMAWGHPMGNFSISHYSGITVERGQIRIRYFLDIAEIPTFQEMQQSGISGRADDPALRAYLSGKAAAFGQGLQVSLNDHRLRLRPVSQNVIFTPGAGDLPTMKFGFVYQAEIREDCATK